MSNTREVSNSTAALVTRRIGEMTLSHEALRKLRRYRLYNYFDALTAALERAERDGRNVVLAEDMQRVRRALSRNRD